MTRNDELANLERRDCGTSFGACQVERNQRTRTENEEFKISSVEGQFMNEEPRLPKGYRHIHSAVEAVLECAGEHVSG
jgi:hypothetical protein